MPAVTLTRRRALNRVNGGLPDPLGLGKPSVWETGRRGTWEPNTRRVLSSGYIGVKLPVQSNGHCEIFLEHRLVMERELGRPLEKGESARHRSADCLDNRPENLALYRGGRPVDPDDAAKRAKRATRRSRSTVYALLPIEEEPDLVRARNFREAEAKADYRAVAVPLSRLR